MDTTSLHKIKVRGHKFKLSRVGDNFGIDGNILIAVDPEQGENLGVNGEIIVGERLMCKNIRSYVITSEVQKILAEDNSEVGLHEVLIKTENSIYLVTGME